MDVLTPTTTPDRFPLTDMQVAYLVGKSRLIELGGRQNYYIELDAVGLDLARARDALHRLVARQEHLRTVILETGEQRVMELADTPPLDLPVVDLTGAGAEEQHESLRRTRHRMCEQGGLEPTDWPLFEVVVSRLRRHRCRVHLRMNLILLDGPSLRRCLEEWLALYRDPAAELPPVTRTFRQWRLDLAAYEQTEEFQQQWRYWQDRLDSLPEAPQLPLARSPAQIASVSFTGRRSFLTGRQWRNLQANYRRHRVLPTTGLLHVYAETLGAWAAQPHFCLNVVHQNLANRRPGSQEVVGQRSATLPLEVDLREGDFWDRARRLQRQLFRDMENGDVTAIRISRELAARTGWSQRAAFPYVFTSNQGPGWDTAMVTRPAFRLVDRIQHTPQVLVDDQIRDAPDGGISSMLDFVEEAFPPGLPDLLVATYRQLLETLGRPDGADTEPDLLPPGHRAVVAAANDTGTWSPSGRLEDGFLRWAAKNPDAVAVVSPGRTLTYRELAARSQAVAGWLRDHRVGREEVVPVVMDKGWEQVVAVLGVLRAGAAYCPIDATTPKRRLRHLLDECGARVVLGQSGTLAGEGRPVLAVDALPPAEPELSVVDGEPADLAYLIYTSGSTGDPKGVMIEHRSALNTVRDINRRLDLSPTDRVFGISSLSFDLSVWDIFGALSAGAALVLPAAAGQPDPTGWAQVAARHGVTIWNSVPALAELLVEVLEQRPELATPPLRGLLLSGDWIPTSLPGRIWRQWPAAGVTALGGATEASIWSNSFPVDKVDPEWRSIPYGRPLANQTMRVLDHRLDVSPPWAVGRIYIGGAGLARGYWRDPDRTAQRFCHQPVTGERLYRTGDLGRYWPDGTIEFLGREDRQVKIQGFRVEPGEVEAAIRTHPGVRECVAAVDPAAGQARLVSLVLPQPGADLAEPALLAHLRERLPRYLVPGRVHVVARLPLTGNGKVDVDRALAELAAAPAPAAPSGPDPAGAGAEEPLVGQLAALWAELLEVPAVAPDDDFFALGGNSLLALRMVNQLRQRFGVELGLGQVFDASTVRRLAGQVAGGDRPTGCAVALSAGTGPPLFLFHVAGGSISRYGPLAEAWPGPVHAFQSRAVVDPEAPAPPADLPAMAAGYREELRGHQPAGPYVLGGWSSGGLLAYEVGQQLAAEGERSHVFMIDSEVREIGRPDDERSRQYAFLAGLAGGTPPQPVVAALRAAPVESLAPAVRDACVAHGLLPPEVDVAGYQRLVEIQQHELRLMSAYRPGRRDQPTRLFVATAERDRPDPVPGWREVCPALTVDPIAADHFSITEQFPAIAQAVAGWAAG